MLRNWLRTACALDPRPADIPNAHQGRLIDRLGGQIVRRRLSVPALVWLVAVFAAAPAFAQPDSPVTSRREVELQTTVELRTATEDELRQTWEVYGALGGTARLPRYVGQARELLKRLGRDLPAAKWMAIDQALFDAEYEPREIARRQAAAGLEQRLAEVRAALADAVPPVCAFDMPNEAGTKIGVAWRPAAGAVAYVIERQELDGPGQPEVWSPMGREAGAAAFRHVDEQQIRAWGRYRYRVLALASATDDKGRALGESRVVQARPEWINTDRLWFLLFMAVFCGVVVFYIGLARRGVPLKVRKIAGLEAVDEAVGRATEMGRTILFIPGIGDMNDIQTIAGLTVLGRVGRTAAEHDAVLEVPTCSSLVMTAARETLHASYVNAGRPEAYDEKRIYYTTGEQFGYAAAITGTMVRRRPATCFYMGSFFAEALMLAETANAVGAIQIAGTAEAAQLPFFVAACDYALIGEEFFAASAYLSGEPQQLGSLKGQDLGKLIVLVILLVGTVLATLAVVLRLKFTIVGDALDFLSETVLNVASQ